MLGCMANPSYEGSSRRLAAALITIAALVGCSPSQQGGQSVGSGSEGETGAPSPIESMLPPPDEVLRTAKPGEEFVMPSGAHCRVDALKYGPTDGRGEHRLTMLIVHATPSDSKQPQDGCYPRTAVDANGMRWLCDDIGGSFLARRGRTAHDRWGCTSNADSRIVRLLVHGWSGGLAHITVPADVPTAK